VDVADSDGATRHGISVPWSSKIIEIRHRIKKRGVAGPGDGDESGAGRLGDEESNDDLPVHYRIQPGSEGRVCRTYGGVQALIAITFDLTLGLIFVLVALGLCVVRRCALMVYRVAVALGSIPLKLIRVVPFARPIRKVAKPAWASFDKLRDPRAALPRPCFHASSRILPVA
jgi:hypothetical protein